MQLPDCFLQRLLLLLRQNISQLVAGLQERVQDPLVELSEEFLQRNDTLEAMPH